jgi:hypothetical protein
MIQYSYCRKLNWYESDEIVLEDKPYPWKVHVKCKDKDFIQQKQQIAQLQNWGQLASYTAQNLQLIQISWGRKWYISKLIPNYAACIQKWIWLSSYHHLSFISRRKASLFWVLPETRHAVTMSSAPKLKQRNCDKYPWHHRGGGLYRAWRWQM